MNERDLFIAALQIEDPAERAAYLDQACGGDTDLRKRLEVLLAANEQCGTVEPPFQRESAMSDPTADADPGVGLERPALIERPGTVIGPYKLLQSIGEGGMGSVFMAEQEKPVRRKVALKVIKAGMDTGQVIARFEAERQALAIMDHPNIARVLDAGATDTGRPFFVMELVKGISITEYCDRNHLTPKERLELFIPVCQAIQHAHQKGIIHRDIKPSNVLVTLQDGNPVPKVIDFGVAKAIDQRLTERTMFTEFGQIIGTLEYMSPEQAEMGALDIDTRSDIYSLGVLLYELLTGSTPLERAKLRNAAFAEILRRIREEEPPKPSTRLSESKDSLPSISAQRKMEPARLTRLVRGELDWIVMKSLEKDRTRRYETANGFARDIQRYLDGDPVEACPPSASYKVMKFARKHRAAFVIAGAFLLLLLAATAVSGGFALWANRERRRAEDREQIAIGAVKRYGDIVRETPQLRGNPGLAKLRATLLKEPLEFFKSLRERLQADRATTRDSLARLAAASFELGYLASEIGDTQDAMRAYDESLAIRERLARDNPLVTRFQSQLATIHNNIGNLKLNTGRLGESLESHEQARAIRDRLVRDNPPVTEFQADLAMSHHNIGNLQQATGRLAEALTSHEQARAIRDRLVRDNPSVTDFQRDLAKSHNNIGLLYGQMGRPAEAMGSYEQAREIWERLAHENLSVTEFRSGLAKVYINIGFIQHETCRPAEALESYEQARAIFERLVREDPSVTEFQSDLGKSLINIGVVYRDLGQPTKAMARQDQARAIWERLASEDPSVTEFQRHLAGNYSDISALQLGTGRVSAALKSHEQARAIWERLARENPSVAEFQCDVAKSQYGTGNLQRETGRPAEALASYLQARAIQERLARENPSLTVVQRDLAASHHQIGKLLHEMGRPAEALASYERARAIFARLARENPSVIRIQSDLASTLVNIGSLQRETGRPAEALESCEQARAIRDRLVRGNPSVTDFQRNLAASLINIGMVQRAIGRSAAALESYEQACAIQERLARDHPESPDLASDMGGTLNNMATINLDGRQFYEARAKLARAIDWQRKALAANPNHPMYRQFMATHLGNLVRATEGLGRADLADDARRRLAELAASDPAKAVLDARLADVLNGKETARDNAERIQLADRAYQKALHASSARLYAEALANDPKLAEDRQPQHAYNAACAAALAASGQGKDDPPPDEAARAKLRQQAREWLEAELAFWAKIADAGAAQTKAIVPPTLKHWKADADLAGVRDEKELAKLPDEERGAFKQLWKDVDQLLTRAAGSK